jgi:hypothetical protein
MDLARALGREALALAVVQPRRALALLERRRRLMQSSANKQAVNRAQLVYLLDSVQPLVQIGDLHQAGRNVSDARRLHEDMRQHGMAVDENRMLKAEAVHLYARGRRSDALAVAKRQLALMPQNESSVLNAGFDRVRALESIRTYAASFDAAACDAAGDRLTHFWNRMCEQYPESRFVLQQAERSHGCAGPGRE